MSFYSGSVCELSSGNEWRWNADKMMAVDSGEDGKTKRGVGYLSLLSIVLISLTHFFE